MESIESKAENKAKFKVIVSGLKQRVDQLLFNVNKELQTCLIKDPRASKLRASALMQDSANVLDKDLHEKEEKKRLVRYLRINFCLGNA